MQGYLYYKPLKCKLRLLQLFWEFLVEKVAIALMTNNSNYYCYVTSSRLPMQLFLRVLSLFLRKSCKCSHYLKKQMLLLHRMQVWICNFCCDFFQEKLQIHIYTRANSPTTFSSISLSFIILKCFAVKVCLS